MRYFRTLQRCFDYWFGKHPVIVGLTLPAFVIGFTIWYMFDYIATAEV